MLNFRINLINSKLNSLGPFEQQMTDIRQEMYQMNMRESNINSITHDTKEKLVKLETENITFRESITDKEIPFDERQPYLYKHFGTKAKGVQRRH